MKIGEKDVAVFGRSINDLASDIASAHPTPDSLKKAAVSLSWAEEGALDEVAGMMWPALIANGLSEIYRTNGHRQFNGIGAKLDFPAQKVALTFTLE